MFALSVAAKLGCLVRALLVGPAAGALIGVALVALFFPEGVEESPVLWGVAGLPTAWLAARILLRPMRAYPQLDVAVRALFWDRVATSLCFWTTLAAVTGLVGVGIGGAALAFLGLVAFLSTGMLEATVRALQTQLIEKALAIVRGAEPCPPLGRVMALRTLYEAQLSDDLAPDARETIQQQLAAEAGRASHLDSTGSAPPMGSPSPPRDEWWTD